MCRVMGVIFLVSGFLGNELGEELGMMAMPVGRAISGVVMWGRGPCGQLGLGEGVAWQDEPRGLEIEDLAVGEAGVGGASGASQTLLLTSLGRVFGAGAVAGRRQWAAGDLRVQATAQQVACGDEHGLAACSTAKEGSTSTLLRWERGAVRARSLRGADSGQWSDTGAVLRMATAEVADLFGIGGSGLGRVRVNGTAVFAVYDRDPLEFGSYPKLLAQRGRVLVNPEEQH